MGKSRQIRIHPLGSGLTDPEQAMQLTAIAPTAFRKAQDLLVAADHYLHKKSIFSTKSSRLKAVHKQLDRLLAALKHDGFISGDVFAEEEIDWLFIFLSEFSDSFPNWQEEYETLNGLIVEWSAGR